MNYDKSVNCYFCGLLFDERDCFRADEYNEQDGGSICQKCITILNEELSSKDDIIEGEPNDN